MAVAHLDRGQNPAVPPSGTGGDSAPPVWGTGIAECKSRVPDQSSRTRRPTADRYGDIVEMLVQPQPGPPCRCSSIAEHGVGISETPGQNRPSAPLTVSPVMGMIPASDGVMAERLK